MEKVFQSIQKEKREKSMTIGKPDYSIKGQERWRIRAPWFFKKKSFRIPEWGQREWGWIITGIWASTNKWEVQSVVIRRDASEEAKQRGREAARKYLKERGILKIGRKK